jgi:hypothetical protein
MSEELENQEPIIIEAEPGPELGLYGYTVNYNIYKLSAEDFDSAIAVIPNLELSKNHYLIQKPEGMLLITEESLDVDNQNIVEKLQ